MKLKPFIHAQVDAPFWVVMRYLKLCEAQRMRMLTDRAEWPQAAGEQSAHTQTVKDLWVMPGTMEQWKPILPWAESPV